MAEQSRKMDYHLHSVHSMDGRQSIEDICKRAVQLGLMDICLTEHIEPHHPAPGMDKPPVFDVWLREIDEMQAKYPQINLRKGIEIGDNAPYRQEIIKTLDALPLDFRLLSLHLIGGKDPYYPDFFEGVSQQEAYRKYVECRVESVLHFPSFDSLAHLGYVCKFAPYPPEIRPLRYCHAPDAFDTLLLHLAQEGKALEINASGLRSTDSPLPGADLIRRFLELGGEFFTFGSDAHEPDHIYQHVERAKAIACACGARWQVSFQERKARAWPI